MQLTSNEVCVGGFQLRAPIAVDALQVKDYAAVNAMLWTCRALKAKSWILHCQQLLQLLSVPYHARILLVASE